MIFSSPVPYKWSPSTRLISAAASGQKAPPLNISVTVSRIVRSSLSLIAIKEGSPDRASRVLLHGQRLRQIFKLSRLFSFRPHSVLNWIWQSLPSVRLFPLLARSESGFPVGDDGEKGRCTASHTYTHTYTTRERETMGAIPFVALSHADLDFYSWCGQSPVCRSKGK